MAFGIDDGLAAAAGAINLTSTLVEVVKKYQKSGDADIEALIDDVRAEALKRIKFADEALADFETMLDKRGIDPKKNLNDIIRSTGFFSIIERRKLRRFQDELQTLGKSVYAASDDISALVQCKDRTGAFGEAVVETAARKHKFLNDFLNAPSLEGKIKLLRNQLVEYKVRLNQN